MFPSHNSSLYSWAALHTGPCFMFSATIDEKVWGQEGGWGPRDSAGGLAPPLLLCPRPVCAQVTSARAPRWQPLPHPSKTLSSETFSEVKSRKPGFTRQPAHVCCLKQETPPSPRWGPKVAHKGTENTCADQRQATDRQKESRSNKNGQQKHCH